MWNWKAGTSIVGGSKHVGYQNRQAVSKSNNQSEKQAINHVINQDINQAIPQAINQATRAHKQPTHRLESHYQPITHTYIKHNLIRETTAGVNLLYYHLGF